jgi:hypothetical protein
MIKNGRYEETNNVRWYLNGQLHRDNDLPAIEWNDGDKYWYQHGQLHRENDLPAYIIIGGNKYWYQHGKYHRTAGPAIECADGNKSWYLNGELLDCKTQSEFERLMRLKAFW